jgi:hypothetical protein
MVKGLGDGDAPSFPLGDDGSDRFFITREFNST